MVRLYPLMRHKQDVIHKCQYHQPIHGHRKGVRHHKTRESGKLFICMLPSTVHALGLESMEHYFTDLWQPGPPDPACVYSHTDLGNLRREQHDLRRWASLD